MLGQQWVSEWEGWQELQQDMTEKRCMRVAARLHDIPLQQILHTSVTNVAALRALEAVGFSVQPAQSFGVNNCLIDAICLSLCAVDRHRRRDRHRIWTAVAGGPGMLHFVFTGSESMACYTLFLPVQKATLGTAGPFSKARFEPARLLWTALQRAKTGPTWAKIGPTQGNIGPI